MLVSVTHNPCKMFVVLCMGIVMMLGVSCHLHASSHRHIIEAGHHQNHHDHDASPAFDDLACIVAVIPYIDHLFALPFRSYHMAQHPMKRFAPAVEFDIPPRFLV